MDIEKPNCIGCHHIHPDNGNCTAVGGFCTAVPAANCPLIQELRAENEKMRAELEQVKAERDAAVESIPHECKTCVYHTVFFNGCTPDHDCTNPDGGCSNNCDRWKWSGWKHVYITRLAAFADTAAMILQTSVCLGRVTTRWRRRNSLRRPSQKRVIGTIQPRQNH